MNLLALNAAAEAARTTSDLIEETVLKINNGKGIVEKANDAFKEVAESSATVGSLVGKISTALQEQAQGFDNINQAVTKMDSVIQQNSAAAKESTTASTELDNQAEGMLVMIQSLRLVVDGGNKNALAAQHNSSEKVITSIA